MLRRIMKRKNIKSNTKKELKEKIVKLLEQLGFNCVSHPSCLHKQIYVNNKLVVRSKRLIQIATGCDSKRAAQAFEDSGRRPKIAIVMVILAIKREEAERLLQANEGRIGQALTTHKKHS